MQDMYKAAYTRPNLVFLSSFPNWIWKPALSRFKSLTTTTRGPIIFSLFFILSNYGPAPSYLFQWEQLYLQFSLTNVSKHTITWWKVLSNRIKMYRMYVRWYDVRSLYPINDVSLYIKIKYWLKDSAPAKYDFFSHTFIVRHFAQKSWKILFFMLRSYNNDDNNNRRMHVCIWKYRLKCKLFAKIYHYHHNCRLWISVVFYITTLMYDANIIFLFFFFLLFCLFNYSLHHLYREKCYMQRSSFFSI